MVNKDVYNVQATSTQSHEYKYWTDKLGLARRHTDSVDDYTNKWIF